MGRKFDGTSSGGTATVEDALIKALQAAQKALNNNHFDWTLKTTSGDYGGIVGKNIKVTIEVT